MTMGDKTTCVRFKDTPGVFPPQVIYIYAYVYIHTHIYIYTYTYTYVHTHTHTCVCVCMYTYVYMHMYTYTNRVLKYSGIHARTHKKYTHKKKQTDVQMSVVKCGDNGEVFLPFGAAEYVGLGCARARARALSLIVYSFTYVHACIYVCMYVCMYMYIRIHSYKYI